MEIRKMKYPLWGLKKIKGPYLRDGECIVEVRSTKLGMFWMILTECICHPLRVTRFLIDP